MAINEWWAADPEQRYWMEITDRSDLGADLFAPTTDGSGNPYWGYELITYVQPGDIVLHWHKTLAGEPGIVGWSQATGSYEDKDISWQAHGTVGRASGSLKSRPAWRMPLLNYTPLASPVLISKGRAMDSQLRQIQVELEDQYPGGTLYFPFGFSTKRPLRAQQTYFVKMPREVLEVLGLHGPPTGNAAKTNTTPFPPPPDNAATRKALVILAAISVAVIIALLSLQLGDKTPSTSPAGADPGGQVSDVTTPGTPTTDNPGNAATPSRQEIRLKARSYSAKPFETVPIEGRYVGSKEGTILRLQRKEGGRWMSFPLPSMTDQSGNFTAHVELGRPGVYRLRIFDPEEKTASNVFRVHIN